VVEEIRFRGHSNVRATHSTTLEITREPHLTPRGDCIIGVGADKAPRDFSDSTKALLSQPIPVKLLLHVGPYRFSIQGKGDPRIDCSSPTALVVRRSDYVCGKTIMVHASAAANNIPRPIVQLLRQPQTYRALLLVRTASLVN